MTEIQWQPNPLVIPLIIILMLVILIIITILFIIFGTAHLPPALSLQPTVCWYILNLILMVLDLVFNLNIINIVLNQILNKNVRLKVFFSFIGERWLFFKTSVVWILPEFSYKYFKNYKLTRGLLFVIANQILWMNKYL